MKVISREPKENSAIELTIEVGAAEFDAAIQTVYRKSAARFHVPGFRKGKAPRKIIESMYGAGVFYEDAINEAYPAAFDAAIQAEGIHPVAHPSMGIVDVGKEGFVFKALVTVKPPVTLGQYKGLTAPKDIAPVTEEDIDGELRPLIERAAHMETVERAAAMGDTAVLDFEGFENGVPFEGGKAEGHSLELGSGSFIPGFEEGVVGLSAGEEKEISLTFPEDYTPELAGKDVIFRVKLHEVKTRVMPALDDELAKDVSEFETLAELRKDLGDKLAAKRAEQAGQLFEQSLIEQVTAGISVELPEAMIIYQAEKILEEYNTTLKSRGMSLEQYMSITGTTQEALTGQAMDTARQRLLRDLALEEVAAVEGLEVTEADREAEYKALSERYSVTEEMVRASVPESSLDRDLLVRKAVELIVASAKAGVPAAASDAPEEAEKKPAKKAAAKKTAAKPVADEDASAVPAKKPRAKKSAKPAEEIDG